jgi:acetyltransferase
LALVCDVKEAFMNTSDAAPSVPQTPPLPDFCGRPGRINLDQMVAVKGLGKLILRPIRLDDEQEMVQFHRGISDESIYMRYFEYLGLDRRTAHERLVWICTNAPESYAIVVEHPAALHRPAAILAVGRLTKTPQPYAATFDTLIIDDAQATKLPKVLLTRLIKIARAFGFQALTGELLVADHDALNLCRALGFSLQTLLQDGLVRVTLVL